MTLHLGFVPSQLSVTQGEKTRSLAPRKAVTWRPAAGVASIFAVRKAGGDASYAVRIKVR